jgi:hypothetical protein
MVTPYNMWQEEEVVEPKSEEHHTTSTMAWWLPATTGTIAAMLASTILSACIGYGAGLGIIADETGPHHHAMVQPTREPYLQVHYKLSSTYSTPSMEERKADLLHKIEVGEELRHSLSQQSQEDRAFLQGVERLRSDSTTTSTTTSSTNLSIQKSKAYVQNKLRIEEGMLNALTEDLQKYRADLQGLERLQFYEQQARADNLLP